MTKEEFLLVRVGLGTPIAVLGFLCKSEYMHNCSRDSVVEMWATCRPIETAGTWCLVRLEMYYGQRNRPGVKCKWCKRPVNECWLLRGSI